MMVLRVFFSDEIAFRLNRRLKSFHFIYFFVILRIC